MTKYLYALTLEKQKKQAISGIFNINNNKDLFRKTTAKMSSTEKRLTTFPGNPVSSKRRHIDSQSKLLELHTPLLSQIYSPPPALPFKINPQSNSACHHASPWKEYYIILKESQAGEVTIAYRQEPGHQIVAIRELKPAPDDALKNLRPISHTNVVAFQCAYLYDNVLYFVYEYMDVSLAEIQSTPCGKFASFQIAAICKDV